MGILWAHTGAIGCIVLTLDQGFSCSSLECEKPGYMYNARKLHSLVARCHQEHMSCHRRQEGATN